MPVLVIGGIEIGFLAAALLALGLVLALDLFAHAVSNLFPAFSVPVLGSLRNHIIGAINGSIALVWNVCKGSYQYLVHLLNDPVAFFTRFINIIHGSIAELVATATWIKNTLIPSVIRTVTNAYVAADNRVQAWVTALVANVETDLRNGDLAVHNFTIAMINDVEADARTLYADSIGYTKAVWGQVETDIANGDTSIRAWTTAIVGDVETDARNLYSQAIAYTNGAVAVVEGDAVNLFKQAERDILNGITTAETAAISAINGSLVTDLPNVWPAVRDAIGDIDTAAAGAFTDVTDLLGNLDLSIPTSIAGTLATVLPITAALSKLAAECTIPNCRNLSQVGRDLQALFGIAEDAAFLALLAEIISDPAGAAQDALNVVVPVLDDTANAAKTLIGI